MLGRAVVVAIAVVIVAVLIVDVTVVVPVTDVLAANLAVPAMVRLAVLGLAMVRLAEKKNRQRVRVRERDVLRERGHRRVEVVGPEDAGAVEDDFCRRDAIEREADRAVDHPGRRRERARHAVGAAALAEERLVEQEGSPARRIARVVRRRRRRERHVEDVDVVVAGDVVGIRDVEAGEVVEALIGRAVRERRTLRGPEVPALEIGIRRAVGVVLPHDVRAGDLRVLLVRGRRGHLRLRPGEEVGRVDLADAAGVALVDGVVAVDVGVLAVERRVARDRGRRAGCCEVGFPDVEGDAVREVRPHDGVAGHRGMRLRERAVRRHGRRDGAVPCPDVRLRAAIIFPGDARSADGGRELILRIGDDRRLEAGREVECEDVEVAVAAVGVDNRRSGDVGEVLVRRGVDRQDRVGARRDVVDGDVREAGRRVEVRPGDLSVADRRIELGVDVGGDLGLRDRVGRQRGHRRSGGEHERRDTHHRNRNPTPHESLQAIPPSAILRRSLRPVTEENRL